MRAGAERVAKVYLGLGSNEGDSEAILRRAVGLLGAVPESRVTAVSSLYRTAPIGGPEQPDYLNQVVELETSLKPHRLLRETQRIETDAGRTRTVRWGPRTLDVDILWYHGFKSAAADLQVPHPRMEQRRFVLEPLAELAPDLVLPSGKTVVEALDLVAAQVVEHHSPSEDGRS